MHKLLYPEVSAQRMRAVPVAAQKMGVSGGPCKQRWDFWRHGCDVFCWCPGFWSACVGWESSLGSAFGEALERPTEDRKKRWDVCPLGYYETWLLSWDGPPIVKLSPEAALLRRPSQPPSVLVRFRRQHPKLLRLLTRRRLGLRARPSSRAHHTQGRARVPPAFQPGSAHRTPWRLPRLWTGLR